MILERELGGIEAWGEPRLRAAELARDRAIASAQLGVGPDGRPRLRRPDLVLFPSETAPVAVAVELTVKAARRLEAICRAWARCRLVAEVRYYGAPLVARVLGPADHPSLTNCGWPSLKGVWVALDGLSDVALTRAAGGDPENVGARPARCARRICRGRIRCRRAAHA